MKILLVLIIFIFAGGYYLYNFDKKNSGFTLNDTLTVTQKKLPKLLEKSFWLKADLDTLNQEIKSYPEGLSSLVRNDNNRTPLHYAVRYSRNEKVIPILINSGVNPLAFSNTRSTQRTALHRAVIKRQDSYKFTKELLKYYPDIDIRDKFLGATPLMWASSNKSSPEVINLLLEQGADVNATASKKYIGSTALMLLFMEDENRGNHLTVSTDQLLETTELFMKYGADVIMKNNEGLTALDYMSKFEKINQTDLFKKLYLKYQTKK